MDLNKNGKTFQMKSWVEDSDFEDETPKEINKIEIKNFNSIKMNESEVKNILNNDHTQKIEDMKNPLETVVSIIKSVKGQSIKKKPNHEDICNVLRDAFRYLNNKDSLSFSTHLQNIYKNDRELIDKLYEIDSAYRLVNDLKPKNFKQQQRTKKI